MNLKEGQRNKNKYINHNVNSKLKAQSLKLLSVLRFALWFCADRKGFGENQPRINTDKLRKSGLGNPSYRRKGILFLSALLLFSCQKEEKAKSISPPPSTVTIDFEMDESVSGKRLYRIHAARALLYEETGIIEVIEPKIYFFAEGKINSILRARFGKVFSKTSDLLAKGDVVVATADSTYLFTDSLVWNNREQRIETDALVRIESHSGGEKARIEGFGLVSDAALSKIAIKSEVKGSATYEFK